LSANLHVFADILRNPIRYFENDLILAAWDAAFAYDRKFQDTVEVLEFLNVQMLELRFFDRVLHTAIDEMGDELHKRRKLLSLLHDPYEKPLRKLSEIKMDVSMVRERIDNALKVAGDAYLARVYDEARRKVGTEKWEGTIRDRGQDPRWRTAPCPRGSRECPHYWFEPRKGPNHHRRPPPSPQPRSHCQTTASSCSRASYPRLHVPGKGSVG